MSDTNARRENNIAVPDQEVSVEVSGDKAHTGRNDDTPYLVSRVT